VVADRQAEFERLLRDWPCDLILTDYNLGAFDGLTALSLAKERKPEIPVIFVSGTIGEELAVEVLKRGATDYVLKNRVDKLPLAIRRAMEEVEERARLRRAEEALLRSERKFRELVEEVPGVFYVASPDAAGAAVYVSPQIERMTGYSVQEWLADPAFWAARIRPDDRPRVLEEWARFLRDRSAFEAEHRLLAKDGRVLWVQNVGRLYGPEPGRVRGFLVDITRRKSLEDQLLQAQKMEALGRLAGGVAHDFNNLLTIINGYSELALPRLPEGSPLRNHVQEIRDAGVRAHSLTRQLLAFSRKQVVQPVALGVGDHLAGMQRMLARLVGEDVKISTALVPAVGRVRIDPGHLEQVVINLVVNARDAMPRGGRITLSAEAVTLGEEDARRIPDAKPGPHVRLSVVDTGTGMGPEVRQRLFEPFFTTKELGKGTGLGLSTVHGIVRQAGGTITVESEPGRGSAFHVLLPRLPDGAEAAPPARPLPAAASRGTETILVAEDQHVIRRLAQTVLESAGYRVLLAADGTEALKICEDRQEPIHLLLTDMIMRSMSGAELAVLVRRLHPAVRVLYMSGYTDREITDLAGEAARFIAKPFGIPELLAKVRETLEAR
jgi:hypothetical protein